MKAPLYIQKHLSKVFCEKSVLNPLSANFTKWLSTIKQFVGKLPTNYLSVFDHFVGLALKGLKISLNLQGEDSGTGAFL